MWGGRVVMLSLVEIDTKRRSLQCAPAACLCRERRRETNIEAIATWQGCHARAGETQGVDAFQAGVWLSVLSKPVRKYINK